MSVSARFGARERARQRMAWRCHVCGRTRADLDAALVRGEVVVCHACQVELRGVDLVEEPVPAFGNFGPNPQADLAPADDGVCRCPTIHLGPCPPTVH